MPFSFIQPSSELEQLPRYLDATFRSLQGELEIGVRPYYDIIPEERDSGLTLDDIDTFFAPVHVLRYGGVADNSTDSLAAIQSACKVSAESGKAVVIDGPYFVDINDENDPIELLSNAHLIFTEKGSIRFDFFGLPCFWAQERDGITLENPHIIYDATVATSLPVANANFRTNITTRTDFPARDNVSALLFIGCDNVTVKDPRFTNVSVTNTTVHQHCICAMDHGDATKAVNNRFIGKIDIEAAHMGLLLWGHDQLIVGDIYQRTHAEYDPAVHTWAAAGHSLYVSNASANTNVEVGDIYDEGLEASGMVTSEAHDTMHFRDIDGFKHGKVISFNDYGYGDYSAVKNANCGDIWWKGTSVSKLSNAGAAMRFLANNVASPQPQEFADLHFGKAAFHMPDADSSVIKGNGNDPNFIERLTISDLIIVMDGTALSSATPLFPISCSDSYFKATIIGPNMPANASFIRIDDGGVRNHADVHLVDGPFGTLRAMLEDGSGRATSVNNSFKLRDNNGNERVYSNHTAHEIRHVSEILTSVSGATVTASNLIPDGALLIGLTTIINIALGTGNGTTGYTVGDGSDVDRWGALVATAKNSITENDDWTDGTNTHFIAAQSVVLTATGGNFDGTGTIRVGVSYMIGKSDLNLSGG